MFTHIARNQVWIDDRYFMAGASFYLRDLCRLMANAEYDHELRCFIFRVTGLGATLFLDIYLNPELMDRPELESI